MIWAKLIHHMGISASTGKGAAHQPLIRTIRGVLRRGRNRFAANRGMTVFDRAIVR